MKMGRMLIVSVLLLLCFADTLGRLQILFRFGMDVSSHSLTNSSKTRSNDVFWKYNEFKYLIKYSEILTRFIFIIYRGMRPSL